MHLESRTCDISLVTVCRNAEATILRTLLSVAGQSIYPKEHIIVDGASNDATLAIVREFAATAEYRVTVISESDFGISDAFNKGIRVCSGSWIHLLNSDDIYFDSNVLKKLRAILDCSNAVVVSGAAMIENESGQEVLTQSTFSRNSLKYGMSLVHPSTLVRKSAYDRCGPFSITFAIAMDYEWLLRLEAKLSTPPLQITNICIARMAFGGISHRARAQGYKEVFAAQLLHTDRMILWLFLEYKIKVFLFSNPIGSKMWKVLKPVRNTLRSTMTNAHKMETSQHER